MTTAWILLGVAAVLIVGNALFVAAETALVTVDRNLVELRAREGSVRFGRVRGTLQRLSTYLSGAQLGITVTSLAIGLVAEPSIATLLRRPLGALGLDAGLEQAGEREGVARGRGGIDEGEVLALEVVESLYAARF